MNGYRFARTEHGVDARTVDRERPPTGRVPVLTMHRAKCPEFSKVVLAIGAPMRSCRELLDRTLIVNLR